MEAVVIVRVLMNVGRPDSGLNDAVAPAGKPEMDSETVRGLPLTKITLTVAVTVPPGRVLLLSGSTSMRKSKGSSVEASISTPWTANMLPLSVLSPAPTGVSPEYST
ncbi:MAG: hypothetical protein QXE92_00085 [Thermofilaceae archaeon]